MTSLANPSSLKTEALFPPPQSLITFNGEHCVFSQETYFKLTCTQTNTFMSKHEILFMKWATARSFQGRDHHGQAENLWGRSLCRQPKQSSTCQFVSILHGFDTQNRSLELKRLPHFCGHLSSFRGGLRPGWPGFNSHQEQDLSDFLVCWSSGTHPASYGMVKES